MKRFLAAVVAILCLALSFITCYASDLPEPAWVTINLQSDGSKTLTVTTPTHLIDIIEKYEYSFDSFETVRNMQKNGGEIVISSSCVFSLRYYANGECSNAYEIEITISTTLPVSSGSGVTLLLDKKGSIPLDLKLSSYEIISGADYNRIKNSLNKNCNFKIFDVTPILGGTAYTPPEALSYLFPVGDMDIEFCKLYNVSENGQLTLIETTIDFKVLSAKTDKTGLFVVAEEPGYLKGDINEDGKVTAVDARIALRAALKLEQLTDQQIKAADIDKNGKVTAADARLIMRISLGLDKV